ncbi:MAG: Ig-like domain-containing protein [Treponema sp.]|jgi:hypothetical protein|nr:Ig-like domain-containing protein [Treponema sp.]
MNGGICGRSIIGCGIRVLFTLFPAFVSCSDGGMDFSGDLLRTSRFEVSKWSPGGGYHADPPAVSVSLAFSRPPDRASVERHFSLSADGERLGGSFRWNGGNMTFLPAAPLEINRDYVLTVAADARDEGGLSMDRAFEARFTTRLDNKRPEPVSVSPAMNEAVTDKRAEVRLVFSRAVVLNSLRDYVSFDPSMNGTWRLEDNGISAVFTPAEPWTYGKRYTLEIKSSFTADNGMNMGNDFSSVFTIGQDQEKPSLSGAWRLGKSGDDKQLSQGIEGDNSGWEKDDRLWLKFSEPVDTLSVKNCLVSEGTSFLMETGPGLYDEVIFAFESPPLYESRLSFRLKAGVKDAAGNESSDEYMFKIFADGAQSKPPSLAGIRIPMAPGSAVDKELKTFKTDSLFEDLPVNDPDALEGKKDCYPYNVQTETWIECYFETAPGLSVDTLSLMELFRVETSNNVLVFSPRLVRESGFSTPDAHSGWEQYQRLEIRGFLTNTVNSGVVSILVDSGLQDSGGNRSEKIFRISLLN